MNQDVALIKCDNYNYDDVKTAINKSVELLGGLDKYFTSGEKVLLKVNLLSKKTPEEATTTHPAVVKALAEIFMDFGLKVIIGDSPGGPFAKELVEPIYALSGMNRAAAETGASLNENYNVFECDCPNGLILKKLTLVDMINDVDKVVSVSKLKTHGMMTFTGAVKNLFGTVPGILKAEYHLHMPLKNDFANALIDICQHVNPVLHFMDGITAMEGAGPSAGNPRNLNVILSSASPIHLDKAACRIISLPFEQVPTIKNAAIRGLCSSDFSDVNILGDNIDSFIVDDFDIPSAGELNPLTKGILSPVWNLFSPLVKSKPVFNKEKCVGCGICERNCPAKIIEIKNDKATANLKNCICCFCCQELCPLKAITIKQPFLFRHISNSSNIQHSLFKIVRKFFMSPK